MKWPKVFLIVLAIRTGLAACTQVIPGRWQEISSMPGAINSEQDENSYCLAIAADLMN